MLLRCTRALSATTNTRSEQSSPASAGPGQRAARRGGQGSLWRRTHAGQSLDQLIRLEQHRWRDRQAERLRRREVDDELKLGGLLDGQVAGLGALEDLVDVGGGAPVDGREIG